MKWTRRVLFDEPHPPNRDRLGHFDLPVAPHGCPRLGAALLLILFVATGARVATAREVVIIREQRTPPGLPFGGVVRIVQRIDGPRIREEMTMTPHSVPSDSLGDPGPETRESRYEPMEMTSVWFPEERVWRIWSPRENVYEENTAEDLARSSGEGDEMLEGLREMFGPRESVVQEIDVAVDSIGTASTIAGISSRPYVARATVRFHELESNLGDSVRMVREIWMAASIPGASSVLPRLRDSPARTWESSVGSFLVLLLPVLSDAVRRLDEAISKLPGYIMREELRVESAAGLIGAPSPDSTKTAVLLHGEVLEIRAEPLRPELFRVPEGMRKREHPKKAAPPSSGIGR